MFSLVKMFDLMETFYIMKKIINQYLDIMEESVKTQKDDEYTFLGKKLINLQEIENQ